MSTQNQSTEAKSTYKEVEQALINVIKAGLYYRKPKDSKFIQFYKEKIRKLHQAENPEEYVLNLAITIFPNKDKFNSVSSNNESWYSNDLRIHNTIMEVNKLFFKLAKDHFVKEAQIDKEAEDFFNL